MGARCRFIHCADLHLGSRFRGISERDPSDGERMTESVFRSFSRIVDLAISEKVDFMVISGDAFDEETVTPSTRFRFVRELERLAVPCYIARGNHDPRTSWTDSIPYPANVHEFATEPEHIIPEGLDGVEVVGVSFADWHEERNLPSMIRGDPARFTVACLHCDVDSNGGDYQYSPCQMTDLIGKGVDYWALGHIHKRQVLCESPYMVYPGNIQGRKITESGEKGAYLVTVTEGIVSELRFIPTQEFVWKTIEVDITGKALLDVISQVRAEAGSRDIVRLVFSGSGKLDSMLRLQQENVSRQISESVGCRVCSVEVSTHPDIDIQSRASGIDMVAKVIQAGEGIRGLGRGEIIAMLKENPVMRSCGDVLDAMSDEEIFSILDRATGMMVARLEGSQ